ncbi:hypothetical protein ACFY36_20490 [Actinoplanes sp. NPDC000266]
MDGLGFHVEVEVLESASAGIRQSVADQRDSALENLDGAAGAYGHAGLHRAMENFCDRWNEGLDILVEDAEAIGKILDEAARAYRSADAASAGRLTTDPAEGVVDD